MFKKISLCDDIEAKKQEKYLSLTPVNGLCPKMRIKEYVLKKAQIDDLKNLGNLQTIFGDLDGNFPQTGKKFLVSQVMQSLKNNHGEVANDMMEKLEKIMANESDITYNITIFIENNIPIIFDGNKRTIAFFENRRHLPEHRINYPVFLLISDQSSMNEADWSF